MNRHFLLFTVISSCIIILVSSSFSIDLVFSSHENEEVVIYDLGEDFVSEESIYHPWFLRERLASKKQYPIEGFGKVKLQFKDVETPPPESQVA